MASAYQADLAEVIVNSEISMHSSSALTSLGPWDVAEKLQDPFRRLSAALHLDSQSGACIALSSTVRGEGVSWMTAMLACAIAEQGSEVFAVDGNLHHPGLNRMFAIERADTGSKVVNRECAGSAKSQTPWSNIQVVQPQCIKNRPKELLELLRSMRLISKTILVDCEPLRSSPQLLQLAPVLDGVVLVVEAGRERRAAIRQSLAEIRLARIPVLGVIVNKQDHSSTSFFERIFRRKIKVKENN